MAESQHLANYLVHMREKGEIPNSGFVAYLSSLEQVNIVSPLVASSTVSELSDQRSNLKMIASENYSSLAVQLAQGNLFTDKYAEGYPFHRFYAGCENVDAVESNAAELACSLFGSDHAYVQPHSGADANMVAYWAILSARVQEPFMANVNKGDIGALSNSEWSDLRKSLGNQRLLGMDYYSGGHLTHGYRHNVSSRMFQAESYSVSRDTNLIDYDEIRKHAKKFKPLILLAGYSAYPRRINFRIFKEIADEIGAVFMVDMAHFSGLVAGKAFDGDYDPILYADIVTSTTHKTLRGPRGGMVLCTHEFAEFVNKGCPMVLGGPLPHAMAAKAVAFQEASSSEFETYASKVIDNAATLARCCMDEGLEVMTGGTDNHLLLLDVSSFGLTGRQAESAVREASITLNRNTLPFDKNGPWYTSGLRVGTPALTTLGMGGLEMKEIASILKLVLSNTHPTQITKGKNSGSLSKARYRIETESLGDARSTISRLLDRFPVYPELDLEYLQKSFSQS